MTTTRMTKISSAIESRSRAPIGIFDSGVGGLSVWREIVRQLPHEDTLYVADQAHVPYGPCTQEDIRAFSDAIARFLLEAGCKAAVVACNTASAAALKHLRETFPDWLTIGMEPAVKPAAAITRTGVVGIMATPATFQGRLFQATAGRHASHIQLINQVCDGLAERIEAGQLDDVETQALLRRCVTPILEAGADTIVLACTHYPFVLNALRAIAGPAVTIIDPAPAIARHLADQLALRGLKNERQESGSARFITTGIPTEFAAALECLVGVRASVGVARWQAGRPIALTT